jgi:hypothetical protein
MQRELCRSLPRAIPPIIGLPRERQISCYCRTTPQQRKLFAGPRCCFVFRFCIFRLKTRPKPVIFGLYGWSSEYGFRYIHPANRRAFELLEPVGKLFEKIAEDDEGEWITIRYDEQQFLVRPELFKEIYHKPAFSFGDSVEEVTPAPGQYRHFGLISDVFWNEATDTATYQIVQYKRKLPQVFAASELRAD